MVDTHLEYAKQALEKSRLEIIKWKDENGAIRTGYRLWWNGIGFNKIPDIKATEIYSRDEEIEVDF